MLYRMGIPYIEVTPTQVKQFATLSGASHKAQVLKELYKRWGIDCNTDDEADAVVLSLIGVCLFDRQTLPNLTQVQVSLIDKLHKEQKETLQRVVIRD